MAYRTYVGTTGKDEIQILGNNEYYQPFIDELIKQGIEADEDGCYGLGKKVQSKIYNHSLIYWNNIFGIKIKKQNYIIQIYLI